ncbi:dedicator of cytokinesis-domain-containing protein [Spinellus fusiger]|nr:dedicator of cytokinesis-domain-containing protein [Spinellus fusiger]
MPKDESQIGKLQTLFVDLSPHDLNEGLYLVCRIVRLGGMKLIDKEKDHFGTTGGHTSMMFHGDGTRIMNYFESANHRTTLKSGIALPVPTSQLCRRPFGCAVLHLGGLLHKTETNGFTSLHHSSPNASASAYFSSATPTSGPAVRILPSEHDMRIYTATTESTFSVLHEDIINNSVKDIEKNTRADILRVHLRMLFGQLDQVEKTNTALLQGVPHTLRLGFPDVVFPDDDRNELYITLASGDFAQFGRSRNIQLTLCVRDNITSEVVENALSSGANAPFTTYWESMVFYHDQRPRWGEMIKLKIQSDTLWSRSHVFFTIRHKSSYYASSISPSHSTGLPASPPHNSSEKTIAMGFLPLTLPCVYRDFVADGLHTLYLYKYDRVLANQCAYIDNVPWCYRSSIPSNMQLQEYTSSRHKDSKTKLGHRSSSSASSLKSFHGSFNSPSVFSGTNGSIASTLPEATTNTTTTTTTGKLTTMRDTLTVGTFLCSTQFTQNKTLVKLLNWCDMMAQGPEGVEELLSILDKFTFVGEMEVVKFLGDIFDALLDILACKHAYVSARDDVVDQTLAAIIWVLGIVQDRRFSNFRPVLDVYIEHRFTPEESATHSRARLLQMANEEVTYDQIMKGLRRLCAHPSNSSKAKLLRSSMKVWDYLFRFMVRSRNMQKIREENGERSLKDIMFKEDLQQLLNSIAQMMVMEQPSVMIGTQTLTLQHFAGVLGELRGVLSSKQLVDITTHFVDTCSHFTGKLVGHKLCMILAIVKGPIFNDSTCRFGLAKNVLKWIQMWINSYMLVAKDVIFARHDQEVDHQQTRLPKSQWLENLRLSLTIVSEILDKVRKSCGMASSSLSSSSLSSSAPFSPFSQTLSRPMSTDTMGEEDLLDESQAELISITEVVLQLVPQLLNAYKELQRLTRQAVQALEVTDTIVSSNEQTPVSSRRNSRHSLGMLRERNNSISAKSVINASDSSEGGSKFSVVLQALSTSPSTPFPSTYPFQSSSPKANVLAPENTVVAMVTTGLLDITVVILELFYLAPARQWVAFLNDYEAKQGTEATAALLCKVCHTCMAILFGDDLQILEETKCSLEGLTRCKEDPTRSTRKVPNHWLNMDVIAHHIVLCNILAPAATLFEFKNFLPTTQLEATETEEETEQNVRLVLWRTLFVTLLQTMSSRRLEIENFLPQTQRAVWKLAGNNKGVVGAKVLLQLWRLAGSGHVKSEEVLKPDVLAYFTKKAEVEQLEAIRKEPRGRGVVSFLENDLDMFGVKIMIEKINDTKEKEELKPSSERLSMNMTGEEGAKIPAISILQIDLIPIILRPLCAVAITLHEQSRSAALEVIADIFTIELHMFGELTRIQHLLIATLDRLVMSENKGTEAIRVHMVEELKRLLEIKLLSQDSVKLYEPGRQAVESLSKFMELLLQIRSLPLDDDEFMDERINATLKLMKFIQVIEREEIYIKYVHQLVQLHVGSHNYIEAALTLRFHANLLAWDPYEKLVAIPELGFKAQTSFSRKEKLYWTMIGYLEQGNAWEISVQLCKELAHEYETTIFDFVKLSEVLQRQAQLAQNIVKKERYFPEYFRVGFYGRGFPDSVRNHQYIYRGLEWEKMVSFVERMQNRHPNAQLLSGKHAAMAVMSEEQLKELESSLDGQYLQITAVVPEPEGESKQKMKNSLVPDYVKKYCATNGVYVFSFSRPINKTQQSNEDRRPETDFLNLWTEKTVLTCEDQFPNIARRSKIIHVQVKEVSPIENAVVAVENKNQELLELLKKYSVHLNQKRPPSGSNPVNVSPFSMALNGAVDAPVNGGVPLYRNAFFSQEYWASNPEMHHWIERLKSSIDTQVKIVEQCLEAHNKLVSQDMRPFHSTLVDFYKKNFAEEISRVGKTKKSLDVESKHTVLPETSEQQQRPSVTRQNSTVQPYSPTSQQPSPLMSPVSRAFSIRSPVPEHVLMRTAVENTSISRAESISRSLKMTLRKKSRKKSQS